MIQLNIEKRCNECPYFVPVLAGTINADNKVAARIIGCKHRNLCEYLRGYLIREERMRDGEVSDLERFRKLFNKLDISFVSIHHDSGCVELGDLDRNNGSHHISVVFDENGNFKYFDTWEE